MPLISGRLATILIQCRAHHWIKNLLIFFPLFFAGELLSTDLLFIVFLGFLGFSFTASAVYIINDLNDIDFDREHPVKRFRPLASGAISQQLAKRIIYVLLMVGISISFITDVVFGAVVLIYLVINIAYSLYLKHISIVDVTLVATGFLLRIFAGGILANIEISHWLFLLTFLLSLFLALSKRRDDLLLKTDNDIVVRKAVDGYNLKFIDLSLTFIVGVMILCYIMYTISDDVTARYGTKYVYLTTIPAIIGLLRYIQLILNPEKLMFPIEILYRDWLMRIVVWVWILSLFLIIYVF